MKSFGLFLVSFFCFSVIVSNNTWAQLLIENFEYPAGDTLINNGWVNHSGTGNKITAASGSLIYNLYPGSGIGNSTTLNGGSGSREDIHKDFTSTGSGSLYAAFLVNVDTASTIGDYFFHLAPAFPTTFFKPRVFVKDDGAGNLQFGISKASTSSVVYTTTTYSYNTTYFLVLKYNMPAGDSNDVGSLYINPPVGKEPSVADIVSTDIVADNSMAAVCLRQGSNSYIVQVDGIFINTSWPTTFSKSFTISAGWNMVSFPGNHPNSMSADTLFRFRDLSASVFKYSSSGYESEDTLKVGQGYWLKHTNQRTYNWNGAVQSSILYPKLIYANVDSFNASSGWNLIGAYDYEFLTSDITTNPPGLISGVPYAYNPGFGYQPAVTIQPGRGYWINLDASGKIIYPDRPTFLKEVNSNFINADWVKINIMDASGNQYTLYSSRGEAELNKYILPPKPPVGLFDVRYTTDRFVENISTEKIIDITGAEYPIRISVQGADIKLKDAFTEDLFTVEIKDGEEIVISNSEMNKLKVSSDGLKIMQFELAQNYPNPFNPATKIRYTIPSNGLVTLKVYNTIGEEVASLVNEQQQMGTYEVEFNSSGLASGIYLYKITAGNFNEVKKMILLK
ncbi:MAG: T9SS type A sorting domain-containing protein [Ignavibacteriaceae bacterium]|nr:T9SS type A sorting domain-containing protein [Ignavibacteriaceae bacterium]